MQPKSTQSILWSFCRKVMVIVLIFFSASNSSYAQSDLFNEGFATVMPGGWAEQNLSSSIGAFPTWVQGDGALFPSHTGGPDEYILGNYQNLGATGSTISNWLFCPTVTLTNGDIFTFWTRTVDAPAFPDRLQVRLSTNGSSVNVGNTDVSVGDYTTLLLDINPTYSTTGYPNVWTLQTITISGLAAPIAGRIAFRYFVEDGGPAGNNSDNIGIDDVKYFQAVTPVCSGTPALGNTIASLASVCPGVPVSLSAQNVINGSGVTYQWQSGPTATGPFTDIAGATTNAYSTTVTADTYFQLIATCAAVPGTSTPVLVALTPPSGCFCTPVADCTLDDLISNVVFAGINNASDCAASSYTNYLATVAPGNPVSGAANPISVTVGPGGTEYVTVWIDYDHSGSFEPNEYTLVGNGNGTTINGSINIPSTAQNGLTRMRVRVRYNAPNLNTDACLDNVFGETEDYAVDITPCIPGSFSTQPASVTTTCAQNATFSTTAAGSFLTYQWQTRASATAIWTTVTDGPGITGATTNTLDLAGVTASLDGSQYRVLISGGCTATDFSSIATLTVNPLVIEVDPPSYAACAPIPATAPIPLSITTQNGIITTTTVSFASTGTQSNIAIPDGDLAGIISTIPVSIPAGAVITGASVKLNIAHLWVGDLIIALKAPNGNVLNLDYALTHTGGAVATTGFTNTIISSTGTNTLVSGTDPWTGTFAADADPNPVAGIPTAATNLSPSNANVFSFAGLYSVPSGVWTLGVYDYTPPDDGTLTNWELTITYTESQTIPYTGIWSPATGLFTDAAGTVPYAGTEETTVYAAPSADINYTVTVNSGACPSDPVTIPFTFGTPSGPIVDQPQSLTACIDETVSFTSDVASGSNVTYQWQQSTDGGATFTDIGGATTNTLTIIVSTSTVDGTQYQLVVTSVSCAGSVTSDAAILSVNAPPAVTVTAAPYVRIYPGLRTLLTANVNPVNTADTYQWFYNGTTIPGATQKTYEVNFGNYGIGEYAVEVRDPSLCSGTSRATLAIADSANSNLFIWPNPSSGQFVVAFSDPSRDLSQKPRILTVYDSKGALIYQKNYSISNPYQKMDVNISSFGKGVYIVYLTDTEGVRMATGRVVVR